MEIYKRGQGTYARILAIACFIIFAGWLCVEIYRVPSDFEVVVRIDKMLDARTMRSAMDEGIKDIKVKGLANQKVDMSILDQTAGYFVETVSGTKIMLAGEKYTAPKIKKLQEEGVKFVPVEGRDAVALDDLIPGMQIKNPLMVPKHEIVDYVEVGKPLTEEQASRLSAANSPQGVQMRNVYPDEASFAAKDAAKAVALLNSAQVKAGMVLAEAPPFTRIEELARKGGIVSKELIARLKSMRREFPTVSVDDDGRIGLAEAVEFVEGRYLRAAEQRKIQTWITKGLFTIPLVKLEISAIFIIAFVLFLALAGGVLYTWNLKRWNDLLIETQVEMKKVSWPKRQELVGSSVIVIFMCLVLGFYLYLVDLILTFLSKESGLYASG